MFVTYRYATGGVFHPTSCQILGVGCLRLTVWDYADPAFARVHTVFELCEWRRDWISGHSVLQRPKVGRPPGRIRGHDEQTRVQQAELQLVFFSFKMMTLIVMARMVEQGLLDYNERIATYWPRQQGQCHVA